MFFDKNFWFQSKKLLKSNKKEKFSFFFEPQTQLLRSDARIYLYAVCVYWLSITTFVIMSIHMRQELLVDFLVDVLMYFLFCFCFLEIVIKYWLIFFLPVSLAVFFANKGKNQLNFWLIILFYCSVYLFLGGLFSTDYRPAFAFDAGILQPIEYTWWDKINPLLFVNRHILLLYCSVFLPFLWELIISQCFYRLLKPAEIALDDDNLDADFMANEKDI